jgi:hypothetical protein
MVTNRDRKSFGSRQTKKNPKAAQTTGNADVLIRIQAFRDPLRGELPHVQIFVNCGPNPFTWDAQLITYTFIRNLASGLLRLAREFRQQSSGWSMFWVVQDEALHRWKNHHVQTEPPSFRRWRTMAHVPLMFLSKWLEFRSAACLEGKKTWWKIACRFCWKRTRRGTADILRKVQKMPYWHSGHSYESTKNAILAQRIYS